MKTMLRVVVAYVVISVVLGALALFLSFPARPTTGIGWLLLFALALPLTLIGELVGDALFRNPLSQAVEKRTQRRSFSWLRIATGLVVMLTACVAVVGVSQVVKGAFH